MTEALVRLEVPGWRSQWEYSIETMMYDVRLDGYPKCAPHDRLVVVAGVSPEFRYLSGNIYGVALAKQCEEAALHAMEQRR